MTNQVDLSRSPPAPGSRTGYITLRNGYQFWAEWIEEDQDREGIWIVAGLRAIWYRADGAQVQIDPSKGPVSDGWDIVRFEPGQHDGVTPKGGRDRAVFGLAAAAGVA